MSLANLFILLFGWLNNEHYDHDSVSWSGFNILYSIKVKLCYFFVKYVLLKSLELCQCTSP
jgi:hypothetical protein